MHQYSGIEIYQTEDGQEVQVQLDQDTLWLSQAQMAELFGKDSDTIGLHLKNIFKEGELDPQATTEESSVVRQEGKRQVRRKIKFYKQRFEQNAAELEQALALIKKASQSQELSTDTGRGLLDISRRYTQTFLWLQRYDEGLLEEPAVA